MSIDPVSLAITAAMMAAQMAITASQKIEGPRLDSTDVSLADYGTPIPRFWGKRRFDGCPIIWAEQLREKKVTQKGKAGKNVNYKYYGTWAVLICDHQIDAVSRIWLDKHLCYQTDSAGPVSPLLGSDASILNGDTRAPVKLSSRNMRIYLGTENQEPDPRMESWCEDRYGPDTCPAYRGVSYIVFQDIPLEKFGNRIPQIALEAVSEKAGAYPYEQRATDLTAASARFYFGGEWAVLANSGTLEWWDTATRQVMGLSPGVGIFSGSAPNVAVASDGTAYFAGWRTIGVTATPFLYSVHPLRAPVELETDAISAQFECTRVFDVAGATAVLTAYLNSNGFMMGTNHVDHPYGLRDACVDSDGNIWKLFQPSGPSDEFRIEGPSTFTFAGNVARSGRTHARICWNGGGLFVHGGDGFFYIVEGSGTVTNSGAASWLGDPPQLSQNSPERRTFWDGLSEYSLEDGSLIRALDKSNWSEMLSVERTAYDPLNQALWTKPSAASGIVTILYLDRVGSNGVTLQTVVESVADWCGITVDASALDQTVLGYSVTQGSGKDMISPLLDIHDSDARPHDFTIEFVKRGNASTGAVLTRDFVRDGDEARYTVSITQDTDLPRRITLNFADVGKDQQTNTVISQRPLDAVDSVREQTLDLTTYVSTPAEAQQLTDRYFRRVWNARETVTNSLTAQELVLEPGDVRTLSLDGVERNVRCTKVTLSGGRLNCEWVRDFPSLTLTGSGTGADMDGREPETIYVPAPTKGFVLDIPLVRDSDNSLNPLIYYAAGKYVGSWPGAVVYENGVAWNTVDSSSGATWGYATDTLPNANPWLWDRSNSVNIKLFGDSLSSATEAEIDADPTINMAYLGGELVNFATAILESDGTYTLRGLKRGRRGTEGRCGTHAAGDEFVLVTSLHASTEGLSDVGTELDFQAASLGRDPSASPVIAVDFVGNSLRPYAPARVKWTTDGTDMFGEIIRRTRVGGAWVGGTTIPMSENSEAYSVDVLDGGGNVTDTISVVGTNAFTILGATTPPAVNAYQISDAVGRGFALAA